MSTWFKFEDEADEEASHEANIFMSAFGAVVEWYHTAVGQVTSVRFDSVEEAEKFLQAGGYQDFSS